MKKFNLRFPVQARNPETPNAHTHLALKGWHNTHRKSFTVQAQPITLRHENGWTSESCMMMESRVVQTIPMPRLSQKQIERICDETQAELEERRGVTWEVVSVYLDDLNLELLPTAGVREAA